MKRPRSRTVFTMYIEPFKAVVSKNDAEDHTIRFRRKCVIHSSGRPSWRSTDSFSRDELETLEILSGSVRAWIVEQMLWEGKPWPDRPST